MDELSAMELSTNVAHGEGNPAVKENTTLLVNW